MRGSLPALTAFILVWLWTTGAQGRVLEGDCSGQPGPLALVMQAVDAARPLPCLPKEDPRRPGSESRELEEMRERYLSWARATCARMRCLSNAWGRIADLRDYEDAYRHVMAGCGKWAEAGSDAIGRDSWRYWTIREVQFGHRGRVGEAFHWVVEVENTRTGERICFDGWNGASRARSWAVWHPECARPGKLDPSDVFRASEALVASWGTASYRSGCEGRTEALCDHPDCRLEVRP